MDKKGYVCFYGLENIELEGNSKYQPCCGGWVRNIQYYTEDSYEDVLEAWNSKKFKEFRDSIVDGSYRYCNGNCYFLSNLKNYQRYVDLPDSATSQQPESLKLVGDRICNLRCIMCRNEPYRTSPETVRRMFEDVWKCRHSVKRISLSGQGDLFFSKYTREWLKRFKKEDFPKLEELYVDTNGLYMTPELMNTMKSAVSVMTLHISIDAATKETYEKVRRGGKWETLVKNIKSIRDWYPVNRNISFSYCISSYNYQEVSKFVSFLREMFSLSEIDVVFAIVEPRDIVDFEKVKLSEEMLLEVKKQVLGFPQELKYQISGIEL